MKTLIQGLLAATMIVGPLAATAAEAAPFQRERTVTTVRHQPNGRTVVTERRVVRPQLRAQNRTWRRGERFDRRQARDYRVIDSYRSYRLRTPPRGYHWVRSGNDAVLVGIAGGIIASVLTGAIR